MTSKEANFLISVNSSIFPTAQHRANLTSLSLHEMSPTAHVSLCCHMFLQAKHLVSFNFIEFNPY